MRRLCQSILNHVLCVFMAFDSKNWSAFLSPYSVEVSMQCIQQYFRRCSKLKRAKLFFRLSVFLRVRCDFLTKIRLENHTSSQQSRGRATQLCRTQKPQPCSPTTHVVSTLSCTHNFQKLFPQPARYALSLLVLSSEKQKTETTRQHVQVVGQVQPFSNQKELAKYDAPPPD